MKVSFTGSSPIDEPLELDEPVVLVISGFVKSEGTTSTATQGKQPWVKVNVGTVAVLDDADLAVWKERLAKLQHERDVALSKVAELEGQVSLDDLAEDEDDGDFEEGEDDPLA